MAKQMTIHLIVVIHFSGRRLQNHTFLYEIKGAKISPYTSLSFNVITIYIKFLSNVLSDFCFQILFIGVQGIILYFFVKEN